MALGVRSYGNTLLTQNLFVPDNIPNKLPALKAFSKKILEPTFKCIEADCGTKVGRLLQVPEAALVGLITLETNQRITDQDVTDWILDDIYTARVRDVSACTTERGFCRNCGNGYNSRVGLPGSPEVGSSVTFTSSARSYQNYIAGTFSGSVMGWRPVAADPLPGVPDDWNAITSHGEMDNMCNLMKNMGIARDDFDYLYTVTDVLERALLIIGTYGVYGSV